MNDYNITETELVRMGFRLGSNFETYRMDGMADDTWFYLQVELLPSGAVSCTTHAESLPLLGDWQKLDRKEISSADDLRELVDEVFEEIFDANQSLIRTAVPLSYYEFRG